MILLATSMFAALLSACSSGSNETAEKSVLRVGVLYGGSDNEPWIRQQYTDMYEMMNPNVEFEFVSAINYDDQRYEQQDPKNPKKQPDPFEKMKEMLTGDNPVDMILNVDYNMLKRLTQDNLLLQLDPLITKDKFDISDYVPTVIDGIKAAGDNNIYALTPTFNSSALYYNKKIFQDAGQPVPTDKMTWDEVLNLAKLVTKPGGEKPTYGFSFNRWVQDPYSDSQIYAAPKQLKMWDDKGEKMLVNTPEWEKVWSTVAQLYKDKVVPSQEDMNKIYEKQSAAGSDMPYNPLQGDLFLNGQVAMTIAEYSYMNELKRAADNASKIKDFTPVDWDVVTVPVDSANPEVGGNIYLSQLMAINAKAQNSDDAWKFIKFTNSKEWAKLKARSVYEMVARKEFLKPAEGLTFNMDAFTTLKPLPPQSTDQEKLFREKPGIYEAQQPAYELFQEVLKDTKTAKEALAEWETKGNVALEKLKTNPNGSMGEGGEGVPRPLG